MAIIVGIDGTGPADNGRYQADFSDSLVSRICRRRRSQDATKYFRGPDLVGNGVQPAVSTGCSYVRTFLKGPFGPRVLLAGYSRGGLGVLLMAHELCTLSVNIDAMILLDPVDRYLPANVDKIPPNVRHVLLVRRRPEACSRKSFGYVELECSSAETTVERFTAFGTHGAIGGTPWVPEPRQDPKEHVRESRLGGRTHVSFQQDRKVADKLWVDRCVPFLMTHGFWGELGRA